MRLSKSHFLSKLVIVASLAMLLASQVISTAHAEDHLLSGYADDCAYCQSNHSIATGLSVIVADQVFTINQIHYELPQSILFSMALRVSNYGRAPPIFPH